LNTRYVLLAACTLLLPACQTDGTKDTGASGRGPGLVSQAETNAFVEGALAQKNPLDIAVLPIQGPAGRRDLPLDKLRLAFAQGLVKLRYSPLAMEYVDERTVEAGYSPGRMSEHAAFQVAISYWDDAQWRSRGKIDVRAEVQLLDPTAPPGTSLWGGPFQTTLTLRGAGYPNDAAMLSAACEQFAEQVLAHLPARRPELATP
jgi:hypothetical protein